MRSVAMDGVRSLLSVCVHTTRWSAWAAALVLAALGSQSPSEAALVGRTLVANSLSAPMFTTRAPGDSNRLYILERGAGSGTNQTAAIKILDLTSNTVSATPFLSIPGLNTTGEGGALGLAFDPNYATNGKFYVYVTANDSIPNTPFSSYLRQYSVSANPNVANTSFNTLLAWPQPADPNETNHKGGFIGFSPTDGYLYMNLGDGGNGYDQGVGHIEPGGNGQNTSTLFGKTLRLDVSSGDDDFPLDPDRNYRIPDSNPFADIRNPDRTVATPVAGSDEIWAYGLRNPFRAGFDRATGDYWIGDVGQDRREEIDFQPANSVGGVDYGWRLREGFIATPNVGGADPNATDPVWDYKHFSSPDYNAAVDVNYYGSTVIGGVPYRGPDPTLQGVYFFADEGNGRVWTLRRQPGGAVTVNLESALSQGGNPVAITDDAFGNVYITYLGGQVYKITTSQLTPGDFNADAKVDAADLALWQAGFGKLTGALAKDGDANGDGKVDGADLLLWQQNLGWSALNAASATSTGVPEPGSAALALCAFAALSRRRRWAFAACR